MFGKPSPWDLLKSSLQIYMYTFYKDYRKANVGPSMFPIACLVSEITALVHTCTVEL